MSRFPQSSFVGIIGKRAEFDLTVTQKIPVNGFYGTSYIHICRTPQGQVVVYKGQSVFVAEGHSGRVRATVDLHQNYDGSPETVIVRPKMLSEQLKTSPCAQASYVSLVTDGGRRLPPLEQILVGMLLEGDLPVSEKAEVAMDKLYRQVLTGKYGWREEVREKFFGTARKHENGVSHLQHKEAHE